MITGMARRILLVAALALLPAMAQASGRIALVIANGDYKGASLANPKTDAGLVAQSLKAIGFDVEIRTDVDLATFDGAIQSFQDKASGADVALFYFAGHGFAVNDGLKPRNYLLAVEADVASRSDRVLRAGGIPLDEIVSGLSGKAKATLVFIDACRNDPRVNRAIGGTGRGLARLDLGISANVFVGLSTRLGTVAEDGTPGEGSPFARAFASRMMEPGLRIDDAFNEVRKTVFAETNRAQQPEVMQNDLDQAMVLVATAPLVEPKKEIVVDVDPPKPPPATDPRLAEAASIWPGIENSTSIATLSAFRDRFAGTFYADLAAGRLAELQKPVVVVPDTPMTPVDVPVKPKVVDNPKLAGLRLDLDKIENTTPGSNIDLAGHSDMVREIAFSPDGQLIASASNDGSVRLWDGHGGHEIHRFKTDNYYVGFSADGSLFAFGNGDTIEIRNTASGDLVATLPAEGMSVCSVAFSPDGRFLAAGGFGLDDNAIRLYDVASQRRVRIIKGHTNSVARVTFLADGKRLLSDSTDNSIRIWDVATGRQLSAIKLKSGQGGVQSTILSPDGSVIAAGTVRNLLRLWDANTRKLLVEFDANPDFASTLAWSPDGETIAFAGGDSGDIHLWSVRKRVVVTTLKWHTSTVFTMAFSPDGTRLVSGARDGGVRIWALDPKAMAAE